MKPFSVFVFHYGFISIHLHSDQVPLVLSQTMSGSRSCTQTWSWSMTLFGLSFGHCSFFHISFLVAQSFLLSMHSDRMCPHVITSGRNMTQKLSPMRNCVWGDWNNHMQSHIIYIYIYIYRWQRETHVTQYNHTLWQSTQIGHNRQMATGVWKELVFCRHHITDCREH